MTKTIKAHYTNGVFCPLEPIGVEEGAEVILTITMPEPAPSESPFDRCFGGWREVVDTDALLQDIAERRTRVTVREVQF